MLEMQNILEARWTSVVESRDTLETHCEAETESFFILAYCVSLLVFKMPKVFLNELN